MITGTDVETVTPLARRDFLDHYDTHQVGGRTIIEYWIPAEDLASLNANIVGRIEVVAE